jgi:hypothetical protein
LVSVSAYFSTMLDQSMIGKTEKSGEAQTLSQSMKILTKS